jgi:hypothetical protein
MRTTQIVPILIAACLVASTSCSDAASPTSPGGQAAPPALITTLNGVIHLSATKVNGVVLSLADGGEVALDGSATAGLENVENAEVEVRGLWSADTLVVSDFLVRRVDGAEVMDGILVSFFDQRSDGDPHRYGISLTRGSLVTLMDPPTELLAHLGQRVWIAESIDGQASAFGVISRYPNAADISPDGGTAIRGVSRILGRDAWRAHSEDMVSQ